MSNTSYETVKLMLVHDKMYTFKKWMLRMQHLLAFL